MAKTPMPRYYEGNDPSKFEDLTGKRLNLPLDHLELHKLEVDDFNKFKQEIDHQFKNVASPSKPSKFNPTLEDGYSKDSIIFLDNGIQVISTSDNNKTNPNQDMTGWEIYLNDSRITTWTNQSQRDVNEYIIYGEYFGTVSDGNENGGTDNTIFIQNAVNYAEKLSKLKGNKRVTLFLSGNLFLKPKNKNSSGWFHGIVIPSNITIKGDATIYSKSNYDSRSVLFLLRGSNIIVDGINFVGSAITSVPWDIPIGAGTTYDNGIKDGIFSDLKVLNCIFNYSWISVSIQCKSSDSGNVIFDNILFENCTSNALDSSSSSGNFNVRSDPPHKIRNVTMSNCTARNGKTASSFNYVGVKGGNVNNCTSYLNSYAACEVENGCEGINISNLNSYDDAIGLWIDDSRWINFNNIFGHYTTDSIDSPLLGKMGAYRRIVMISRSGIATDDDYKTTGIVGSNIIGINSYIYAAPFGTSPKGKFGDISISNIYMDNSGATSRGFNSNPFNMTGGIRNLTISDVVIESSGNGTREFAISASNKITLRNIESNFTDTTTESDILGDASLFMDNVSLKGIKNYPKGHIEYSGIKLDGSRLKTNRSGSFRIFYDRSGHPNNSVSSSLGSLYIRVDDPGIYFKEKDSGLSTGWKKFQLVD